MQTVDLIEMCIRDSSSIAQLVEHAAVNRAVVGSSPTGGAKVLPPLRWRQYFSLRDRYGPLAQLVRAAGS